MKKPKNQAAEMIEQLTIDTDKMQSDLDTYVAGRKELIQKNLDTIAVLQALAEWEDVPE